MSITSILVANRGEIAVRIARTARRMGLRSVAVHSDADRGAPHARACDIAIGIGGLAPADSYLRIGKLIAAAKASGADAVHPGYGFLSENADFARACIEAGLVFIGPSPEAIAAMGDKAAARRRMREAGLLVLEGYDGDDQSDTTLAAEARRIGFPVMIKASAGGGGRGMRLVPEEAAFAEAARAARAEAEKAFGDGRLILERAALRPRHVEVQVFGDAHGNIIHLGERDCSIQRRRQKLIEEAPAPGLDPALRAALGAAAVTAARSIAYAGAGTVEFLLDATGRFTFMEMNTRLQVEHPVTEAITGLDLVEWQIRVARGEKLPLAQDEVRFAGHAIEARLVAEDAGEFLPQTGVVSDLSLPEGEGGGRRPPGGDEPQDQQNESQLRFDHALACGLAISPHYDSLLGKLIALGATREAARTRLIRALVDLTILGVATNRAFLQRALADEAFIAGEATTAFIAERFPGPAERAPPPDAATIALAFALAASGAGRTTPPFGLPLGWSNAAVIERPLRLAQGAKEITGRVHIGRSETLTRRTQAPMPSSHGATQDRLFVVRSNERNAIVIFTEEPQPGRAMNALVDGEPTEVRFAVAPGTPDLWLKTFTGDHAFADISLAASGKAAGVSTGKDNGIVAAPMHAKVASIRVAPGDIVAAGAVVATIEAMKLEHALTAGLAGRVTAVHIAAGASVRPGEAIVTIAAVEEDRNRVS